MRRNIGGKFEFRGLNLSVDKYSAESNYAIVADNVFIDSGRPVVRLGRRELSEDQSTPQRVLGIFNYATVDGRESMIIVRTDAIYQRIG